MAEAVQPARILVVDDDAWILRMVTSVLEKRGYVVETAVDGEDGINKASRTCRIWSSATS